MDTGLGSRIVIAPHGLPPLTRAREACCRLLLACGADFTRIFEGDPRLPEAIAERLPPPREPGSPSAPLVLLTRTVPLVIAVLRLRGLLEQSAPWLAQVAWLVFHDPETEPRFVETATAFGALDSGLELAPYWYAPDERTYLVISPLVADARFLRARLDALTGVEPERRS